MREWNIKLVLLAAALATEAENLPKKESTQRKAYPRHRKNKTLIENLDRGRPENYLDTSTWGPPNKYYFVKRISFFDILDGSITLLKLLATNTMLTDAT